MFVLRKCIVYQPEYFKNNLVKKQNQGPPVLPKNFTMSLMHINVKTI